MQNTRSTSIISSVRFIVGCDNCNPSSFPHPFSSFPSRKTTFNNKHNYVLLIFPLIFIDVHTYFMAASAVQNKTLVCQDPHSYGQTNVWQSGDPLDSPTRLFFMQVSLITLVTQLMDICLRPLGQSSLVSQILVSFLYAHKFHYHF